MVHMKTYPAKCECVPADSFDAFILPNILGSRCGHLSIFVRPPPVQSPGWRLKSAVPAP